MRAEIGKRAKPQKAQKKLKKALTKVPIQGSCVGHRVVAGNFLTLTRSYVLYTIHIIVDEMGQVFEKTMEKRFSEFLDLDVQLNAYVGATPPLPEKTVLFTTTEDVIFTRERLLHSYLRNIVRVPAMAESDALREFFGISKLKRSTVLIMDDEDGLGSSSRATSRRSSASAIAPRHPWAYTEEPEPQEEDEIITTTINNNPELGHERRSLSSPVSTIDPSPSSPKRQTRNDFPPFQDEQ